jgi:hypothetical protein
MQIAPLFPIILCALSAQAIAVDVRRCQTPNWEGKASVWGPGLRSDFLISYDKDNRRKRILAQNYKPFKQ